MPLCAQSLAGTCPPEVLPLPQHKVDAQGQQVGCSVGHNPHNRRRAWCRFIATAFQPCATQLSFSVQVQGAPPRSHGSLFLMGKLEVEICRVTTHLALQLVLGCNWFLPWPFHTIYSKLPLPSAIALASPCDCVASFSVTETISFVWPRCQFWVANEGWLGSFFYLVVHFLFLWWMHSGKH